MLNSTGNGLTILITTQYSLDCEWLSFAAWYSITHLLPDAEVVILCKRTEAELLYLYQWAYRLRIKFYQFKGIKTDSDDQDRSYYISKAIQKNLVNFPLLVVNSDIMAIREFSRTTLKAFNETKLALNKSIWYFREAADSILSDEILIPELCSDVTTNDITSFIHLSEKCGNFYRKDATPASSGHWSFAIMPYYAPAVMSINEKKVFDLWARMSDIFSVLNQ